MCNQQKLPKCNSIISLAHSNAPETKTEIETEIETLKPKLKLPKWKSNCSTENSGFGTLDGGLGDWEEIGKRVARRKRKEEKEKGSGERVSPPETTKATQTDDVPGILSM